MSRRPARSALASAMVMTGAIALSAGGAAASAGQASPQPPSSPDPAVPAYNVHDLSGVSADSLTDAWAVGMIYVDTTLNGTLARHWNGREWRTAPSSNPGTYSNDLLAVDALSPTDAWAVGTWENGPEDQHSLVEHWDGTRWTHVRSPNRGTTHSTELDSVSAVAPDDVWAVGHYYESGYKTLVEHWDGTQWSVVDSPNRPGSDGSILKGVSAVAADDVWAVGGRAPNADDTPLIEHWDGATWSIVEGPMPTLSTLLAVSARSANDVWAVGYRFNQSFDIKTLIEHWDGVRWTAVRDASGSRYTGYLTGVSARSADDVWAVGHRRPLNGQVGTFTEHWDGSRWTVVPSPNPQPGHTSGLSGVSSVSGTSAWVVGWYVRGYRTKAIIQHWDGATWTQQG